MTAVADRPAPPGSRARADLDRRLAAAGLDPAQVARLVATALAEDRAIGGDVTTAAVIPPEATARAAIVARGAGVAAGLPVAEAVFAAAGAGTPVARTPLAADGDAVSPGATLMTVEGRLAAILSAERTALNLLCHLSGVATLTRRWVDAVAGTGARVRDTRKTLPGLRALQKYAVRCGGGTNHRMSLADAVLVKDNHVAAAGSLRAALEAVSASPAAAGLPAETECDTLAQVEAAVAAGAPLILLDNFSLADMRAAVALVAGRARLEASGGLTLDQAGEVARTGVDYLAVGALTHSAPALDIGLDLTPDDAQPTGTHAADD